MSGSEITEDIAQEASGGIKEMRLVKKIRLLLDCDGYKVR